MVWESRALKGIVGGVWRLGKRGLSKSVIFESASLAMILLAAMISGGSGFSNCLLRLLVCPASNSPTDVPCASENLCRNAGSSSARDTVTVLMEGA